MNVFIGIHGMVPNIKKALILTTALQGSSIYLLVVYYSFYVCFILRNKGTSRTMLTSLHKRT